MNLEVLEPLAVVADDGVFAPVPTRSPRDEITFGKAWRRARERAARVLAEFDEEGIGARAAGRPAISNPTSASSLATSVSIVNPTNAAFTRMLDLTPDQLALLPRWWEVAARRGRVRLTRRLTLETPRAMPGGGWRMRGSLRRAVVAPAARFDLTLWPHLGRYTKLSLEPRRRVHAGRRWFRRGHEGLDRLAVVLATTR